MSQDITCIIDVNALFTAAIAFIATYMCLFWFYFATFSLETSQREIRLKVILYVSMLLVGAIGQIFKERALILLSKIFYSTYIQKLFSWSIPSKANIQEAVFEAIG